MSSVGFGLSPAVGKALSELVIHGRCLFADLSALALSRFADTPPDWRERVGWISAAPVEIATGGGAVIREIDPRSVADKAPAVERHVAVVVVGAGAAGVAAAIAAARSGAEVLLVDENPVDNDMMAMDVPLYFGQRMQPVVRNRALMMERVVEANAALAEAYEAGVDVQLGTYVWGAFVNGPTVRELPGPLLGLADDRRSWLVGYDRLVVAAGARDVALGFPGWERAGAMGASGAWSLSPATAPSPPIAWSLSDRGAWASARPPWPSSRGVEIAGVIEVGDVVRGDPAVAAALTARGVPIYTSHTIREARGTVGEVESGGGRPGRRRARAGGGQRARNQVRYGLPPPWARPKRRAPPLVGARLDFVSPSVAGCPGSTS